MITLTREEEYMALADGFTYEWTGRERCDACGFQAYTLATHPEYTELMFCLHHARRHRFILRSEGWQITDHQEAIEDLAPNLSHFLIPA